MSPLCNREILREASQNALNRHGTGRVFNRQFGFMLGKSTEDTVAELRRSVLLKGGTIYTLAL